MCEILIRVIILHQKRKKGRKRKEGKREGKRREGKGGEKGKGKREKRKEKQARDPYALSHRSWQSERYSASCHL